MEEKRKPIAVKKEDLDKFGCPECGHWGQVVAKRGHTGVSLCQGCDYVCLALSNGATESCIGLEFDGQTVYPKLTEHPRQGIPYHNGLSIKEKLEKAGIRA